MQGTSNLAAIRPRRPTSLARRPRIGELIIQALLFLCGLISVFTTLGLVVALGSQALRFFEDPAVKLLDFLTTTRWSPNIGQFGILPLVTATLTTTVLGLLVAIPLGLAAAVYLSEYATPRARAVLKPILEVLAGIPTVVYGYFALTFMTPVLRAVFGNDTVKVYNMAAAGLVMGIMIVPLICSMSEDALSAVPRALREGSFGLGATRLETSLRVVVPAALSGIIAAVVVGASRAVGETMIMALAAGAGPNFTLNPFDSAETMAGHIARITGGDVDYNSIDYTSIFAVGSMLFLMTLTLNFISRIFVRRFREVYE
ncbi:MAG TPA: phosphate ABC transporter permease subunit PstC [Thermoflexales bacterium]|nr:phosphate ABC transporter permease subunit PstC [Thermoflexales bacterium]HQZ52444.1 phosphate ABC transporter permease subunit PstC [Thermoflexales bacterium]HRA53689.1 phosphate ABC transporter permease subunit PstC [Thermoflexales bacterium]